VKISSLKEDQSFSGQSLARDRANQRTCNRHDSIQSNSAHKKYLPMAECADLFFRRTSMVRKICCRDPSGGVIISDGQVLFERP
jgi:hypothetical protein